MHINMRETKLKEEEVLKQREEALKTGGRIDDMRGIIRETQKEMCYIISLHAVSSTLCVIISFNLFSQIHYPRN
jgi:hypothetical protein